MAISRSQLVKELEPGLNALFGLEYKRYENQHSEIYNEESSDRAFEEEVMLSGFANAQVKGEGSGVSFDEAQETFTARYTHETVALAFAITEEAIEDNLYDRLASRYTKALARSMSNAKQVKSVEPLIQGLPTTDNFDSGDGVSLFNTAHPTVAGTFANTLATQSDLTISRISVSTYASIPNKLTQGRPIQVYIERLRDAPKINVWPVPDNNDYVFYYWRMRRIEDAGSGIQTSDMNFRFFPCLVAGLAYYIAMKIPELMARVPMLKEAYEEQFALAAGEDREKASLRLVPRATRV